MINQDPFVMMDLMKLVQVLLVENYTDQQHNC